MNVSLDPVVAKKLKHYRRRRLQLIMARGLSAGLIALLLAMALVAFVDWYWLLTDRARWALSITAYVSMIVVIWATCVRKLVHRPAEDALAAQVELAEPELREKLRSAVDLAIDDPSAIHDSPVFRSLLQGRVAELMSQVRVRRLLPLRLVAGWCVIAAGLAGLAAALLTSQDPRYLQLARRALLPGANIARVSRIQVRILEPTPHSLTLPEDETVAVVVAISGGEVNEVTLETFAPGKEGVRRVMRDRTDGEYAANVHVAEESIEYRILAGDAITQRFTLAARPRPRVTVFHKTYQYPAYTRLDPETVTDGHGDLIVLEGTQAEMELELDQAVSTAELRIDVADSDETTVIPLIPAEGSDASGRRWRVTVPVEQSGIYKVRLVSRETGFENVFAPRYEIQPQPDLIPRTGFVDQTESTLLLPPNDILALRAMAEDDLPLVSLEQHVSVNGDDWQALPLETTPTTGEGREIAAAWEWDLLGHKLNAGDQITTKLVATDRKGHRGESIPLQIVVASQDFDPARHSVMERKVELYDHLAAFSKLLADHKTSALEAISRLRKTDLSEEQRSHDRAELLDLAARQRGEASALLDRIKAVERDMPAGADAYDLDLTGRVIARLQREHASTPAWLLAALEHTTDANQRKRDLDQLKQVFERTADDAKNVAGHYQHLMTHNLLHAFAIDLNALRHQQELVVTSPTQTWDRLVRQETLLLNQLNVLERLIQRHFERFPPHLQNRMTALRNWSETSRERLVDATESEDKLPQLQRLASDLLNQLRQHQRVESMDGGLPGRLSGSRRDFNNRAGSLYVPLNELAQAARQETQLTTRADAATDSAETGRLFSKVRRYQTMVDLKHRRSLDQLRSRRELTQSRRDADSQYAADAGLTHRAAASLTRRFRDGGEGAEQVPDHLLKIAPAYRTLEAGHHLIIARDSLNVLLSLERWDARSLQAHSDHPRQWDVFHEALALAAQRMRSAGVDGKLATSVDQLRWAPAARDASRKITERRWKREGTVSADHELSELRDQLATYVDEMEPVMAEARAVIAAFAPTIPQMAQQAADDLRRMEDETTDQADAAEQDVASTPGDQPPRLDELAEQQQDINDQIRDLTEALVEDANSRDLLDEQERERARDADDSIAMIQEPARRMNDALDRAEQARTRPQQARDLAQAAEQQERTAQALDLVARHFEKLDAGEQVADSRQQLRSSEAETGIARQLNQQETDSAELAEMAQRDTDELMAQLEEELRQNPAMQQALSEISQKTLEDARNALQFAARDEHELQKANERSDAAFQQKKREVASALREIAADASRLAGGSIAQAHQAGALAKTPEGLKKLSEAQQKLNEAAAGARQAQDDELLSNLAELAKETGEALEQAARSVRDAEKHVSAAQQQAIHADDKARDAARKDAERRRAQFHEQRKRQARDAVRRADDARKRADRDVRNAENQVRNADRRLQTAKRNLSRKPDDNNLKRAVAREESRKAAEQKKVDRAKKVRKQADEALKDTRKAADQVNRRKLAPLKAANPAAELAQEHTKDAVEAAADLQRRAEELIKSTDFGEELTPAAAQLTNAGTRQAEVTQDVEEVAADLARAARHERRLQNEASESLESLGEAVQEVADNEATNAGTQLDEAAAQAQAGAEGRSQSGGQQDGSEQNGEQTDSTGANTAALDAQQAVRDAEEAINQQAARLEQATAQATGAESGTDPGADPGNAQPGANAEPTPAEQARGQQLARTLDELDRQQAAARSQGGQPTEDGGPPGDGAETTPELSTLAQAARQAQSVQAMARAEAQQAANTQTPTSTALDSLTDPAATGAQTPFNITRVNRVEDEDWGKLRGKSADDLARGRSEAVAEAYRKSVETYFRVLAEQARRRSRP